MFTCITKKNMIMCIGYNRCHDVLSEKPWKTVIGQEVFKL